MKVDLGDLNAFVAVARAKGFRDGARVSGSSASSLSEAVRRLEAQLGVRLLNRTTRSVAPTEAGERLVDEALRGLFVGQVGRARDRFDAAFLELLNAIVRLSRGRPIVQCA